MCAANLGDCFAYTVAKQSGCPSNLGEEFNRREVMGRPETGLYHQFVLSSRNCPAVARIKVRNNDDNNTSNLLIRPLA